LTKQLHEETGFVGAFWQKLYHDRNVRDERSSQDSAIYDPVERGSVKAAAD
jgi:hypothetical protein